MCFPEFGGQRNATDRTGADKRVFRMNEDPTSTAISESALVGDSSVSESAIVYGHAEITRSQVGERSLVGEYAIVVDSIVGSRVSINRRNYVLRSRVADNTYTGIGTMLRSCTIGRFCSLSWNVSIGGGDHDYERLTTSPLWRFRMMDQEFGSDHSENVDLQKRFEDQPGCEIHDDVWIGTNAVILRDVTVGAGSVIGAGAVVTRNVDPYTIVAGVPARPLRQRFNDKIIEDLLRLRWWDWPIDVIRDHAALVFGARVNEAVVDQLKRIGNDIASK